MANPPILALENPMDRRSWEAIVHGIAGNDTTEPTNTQHRISSG